MSYLRHASRHVFHTVAGRIESALGELGWTSTSDAERPFGTDQLTVRRHTPVTGESGDSTAKPFTVAITLGDEFTPQEQEIGGPLSMQEYPIFCDVLMPNDALALVLASDIRDVCLGRLDGYRRSFPVIDQITQAPVVDWRISLEDVERVKPDSELTLAWQVVKVTAEVHFPEGMF